MEKLNPFLKGATILICGLILSFSYSVMLNCCIIIVCLILMLFFSKTKVSSVFKIMIPALIAAVSIFFTGLLYTNNNTLDAATVSKLGNLNFEVMSYSMTSSYNAVQLASRILAFAGLGVLFALTTNAEEFVKSLMHQCKLAPKYAYGVLAAFHLLPGIKEEFGNVKMAFKVRGINVSPFSIKPIFAMLVNITYWSENVAMAMESKGFNGDGKRTFYTVTYIKWFDWCFFSAMISMIITGELLLPL